MIRSTRTAWVKEFSCLVSASTFIFHRNWKPGFCNASFEIFGSLLTQAVRWASLLFVVHSAPPRPWARASPVHGEAQPNNKAARALSVLIAETPPSRIDFTNA